MRPAVRTVVGATCAAAFGAAVTLAACRGETFTGSSEGDDANAPAPDGASEANGGGDDATSGIEGGTVDGAQPTMAGCVPAPPSPCVDSGACPAIELVTTLAADGPHPRGLATDDAWVYWAAQIDYNGGTPGVLERIGKTGGVVQRLVSGTPDPGPVAVDTSNVYWVSEYSNATNRPSRVFRLAKAATGCGPDAGPAGCVQPELVYSAMQGRPINQLIVLADRDLVAVDDSSLVRVKWTGSTWSTYPSVDVASSPTVADDDAFLYAANGATSSVVRTNRDTTNKAAFTSLPDAGDGGAFGARHLVSACGRLIAHSNRSPDHPLWAIDKNDAAVPAAIGRVGSLNVYDMAADEKFAYLACADGPGLVRADLSGSGSLLALRSGNIWSVVVERDAIYFAEHGGNPTPAGSIWKIDKRGL